jgi:2-alkyl-3-oxoalkanoate reductase
MKVLVAGADGALGRQLVPRLVAAGHEVVGMTRSPGKRDAITALGANTVIADALECDQVAHAVAEAEPEAIVHELTALVLLKVAVAGGILGLIAIILLVLLLLGRL